MKNKEEIKKEIDKFVFSYEKNKPLKKRIARCDRLFKKWVKEDANYACEICGGIKCGIRERESGSLDWCHLKGRDACARWYRPVVVAGGRSCHQRFHYHPLDSEKYFLSHLSPEQHEEWRRRALSDMRMINAVEECEEFLRKKGLLK